MRAMTETNLKDAFAGESQAHMKYLAFAEKAEKDGFPKVALLFRAISYAEQVHAHNHLKVLDGVGDTAANLEAAIEHLNAHFIVSRFNFCNNPPPDPNAILSPLQPAFFITSSIFFIIS